MKFYSPRRTSVFLGRGPSWVTGPGGSPPCSSFAIEYLFNIQLKFIDGLAVYLLWVYDDDIIRKYIMSEWKYIIFYAYSVAAGMQGEAALRLGYPLVAPLISVCILSNVTLIIIILTDLFVLKILEFYANSLDPLMHTNYLNLNDSPFCILHQNFCICDLSHILFDCVHPWPSNPHLYL